MQATLGASQRLRSVRSSYDCMVEENSGQEARWRSIQERPVQEQGKSRAAWEKANRSNGKRRLSSSLFRWPPLLLALLSHVSTKT